jgi:hypothetical protein
MQISIQAFNDKLDAGALECPHIEGFVLLKSVGIYKPSWTPEGYPAIIVEIKLPDPDLKPEAWPVFVGLKTNPTFNCNMMVVGNPAEGSSTLLENPNCGLHDL